MNIIIFIVIIFVTICIINDNIIIITKQQLAYV